MQTNIKRVLVTGMNGFVGHHLVSALSAASVRVVGVSHGPLNEKWLQEKLESHYERDLTQPDSLNDISLAGFDGIIHLAGLSDQGASFEQPHKYMRANPAMATTLLQKVLEEQPDARVLVISSGAVYAPNESSTETDELLSNSPYTASKIATEAITEYYRLRGVDAVTVRPFNHIGPGQSPGFIGSDFAAKVAAVAAGKTNLIETGNLETRRNYTDVRDVASAYLSLLGAEKLSHQVYNVCSNQTLSGKQILTGLLDAASLNESEVQIKESDPRPTNYPIVSGSNERIKKDTGWEPKIPIQKTLTDLFESVKGSL